VKFSPVSLLRHTASLAEGPCWHPEEQALYFTDIPAGRIWRFDPASSEAQIFHEGEITGGLTFQPDDGWVLFRKNDLAWLDAQGRLKATRKVELPGAERFNDVIADPIGRVYAGTIGIDRQTGGLYRFDLEGGCQRLFQGTGISNGMAFSNCGHYFYWTCTTSRVIYRFDYTPETGGLSHRFCLHECKPNEGLPDGLTVDAQGNLWSARWGAGLIVILSPEGEKVEQIEFPESNISSMTWGGAELRDLYVTSARIDGKPGVHDLFVVRNAGQGEPENRSRLSDIIHTVCTLA
jgi:D-xylono/L-arabinono-1,4-lactonase